MQNRPGGRFGQLLGRLAIFKVTEWGDDSDQEIPGECEPSDLEHGHVASSIVRNQKSPVLRKVEPPDAETSRLVVNEHGERMEVVSVQKHAVVMDLDHEAFLIPSSTPGHYHLYVDLGVPEDDWFDFLDAAAKINLVSAGYAEVSRKRGHSDVRLPWISKAQIRQEGHEREVAREQGGAVRDDDFTDLL